MASKFIKESASWLLKHAGEALVAEGVEIALVKGFQAIFGTEDPTETILGKLDEVLDQVHQVKLAVDALSRQLDSALYQLEDLNLTTILTDLDTVYIEVQKTMEQAAKYADQKDQPGTDEAIAELQRELEGYLKKGMDLIPDALNKANDYLGTDKEGAFLKLAIKHAFDSSNNIITYYSRAKTQNMIYWAYAIKGLLLLQMAAKSESINWKAGLGIIDYFTQQLHDQENLFRKTVGDNTCELVEMLLTQPQWQRQIRLSVEWGIATKMYFVDDPWNPDFLNHYELEAKGNFQHFPWNLNPATCDPLNKVELESFDGDWDPFGEHRMLFTVQDQGISGAMAPNAGNKHVSLAYAWIYNNYREVFYVKPVDVGSDRYRVTRGTDSGYLMLSWQSWDDKNIVAFDEKLMDNQPGDNRRYMWRIELWRD